MAGLIEGNRLALKDKGAVIAMAKKHMGLGEEWLSKGYDYLVKIKAYSVNGGLTKETYKLVLGIGRQYKQVKKDLPVDKFLTLEIQNEALKLVGRQ